MHVRVRTMAIIATWAVLAALLSHPAATAAEDSGLVRNGDLSVAGADGFPDCFQPAGSGAGTPQWDYRDGSVALTVSGSGSWALVPALTDQCAIPVVPDQVHELSVDYTATVAGADLTVMYRIDGTWQGIRTPGRFNDLAARNSTHRVIYRTPRAPAGADLMSFGLALDSDGTLVTDNYSAAFVRGPALPAPSPSPSPSPTVEPSPTASPTVSPTVEPSPTASPTASPTVEPSPTASPTVEPSPTASPTVEPSPSPSATADPVNLTANGDLEAGGDPPDGWILAGWGTSTLTAGTTTAAHTGDTAYRIEISGRVDGDWKLLPAEESAPEVVPGSAYELSFWYRSTSDSNALTVFKRTAAGWTYWTDLRTLPAVDDWTRVVAPTPPIEEGVDRIAWGVSLFGDGVLVTDGYSTTAIQPDPGDPADPVDPGDPVDPEGGPETVGRWTVLEYEMPARTVHSTLLRDGRVLLLAGSGNDPAAFEAGTFRTTVWDPDTGQFTEVPTPEDLFCSGHVTLPDGRVLLQGGTKSYPEAGTGTADYGGLRSSYIFDPATDTFTRVNDANEGHWYPTLTALGNGDVWMAGGLKEDTTGAVNTEMFSTSLGQWLPTAEIPQTWSFWGLYPHMVLMADGRLFYTGGHVFGDGLPGTGAAIHEWQTGAIDEVSGLREKDLRDQSGSVLLPPAQDQRVMIAGGGNINTNLDATGLVDLIDLRDSVPFYRPGADLPGPGKMYLNLVLLPDRTVLAINGAKHNRADDVLTGAIYSPDADSWRSVLSDPVPRNYHSSAALLPDGRVVALGSNPGDNSFEMRISVYEPPYLFRGTRPTISGVAESADHGQSLTFQTTGDIQQAQLLRPMSVTHQSDPNARLVDLPQVTADGQTTVAIPDNPNLLPPGPYMLVVVDQAGIPSVARWVTIR